MSEYVVGVDEVGRGSLVGSTIICAFRSQNSLFDKLPFSVSDSKKINKKKREEIYEYFRLNKGCLLYTSPSPRDDVISRMPSSA